MLPSPPKIVAAGLALFALAISSVGAASIDWAVVGDPGNAADPLTGRGAVGSEYRIQATEVSNAHYADFLNAVASTDPNGLFSSQMTGSLGGIQRSGADGSYTYAARSGRGDLAVNFVSWYDAARFANWVHHGSPRDAAPASVLESGAYTLATAGAAPAPREPGARVFLPNRDEWFKAAYHQPASAGGDADDYWAYATRSNTAPVSDNAASLDPAAASNAANFFRNDGVSNGRDGGFAVSGSPVTPTIANLALSDVGAYQQSLSYYGAYDLNGNVWEWGETLIGPGDTRAYYGGAWDSVEFALASTSQFFGAAADAESATVGFRLAAAPVLMGDYSGNGIVGAEDYTVYRDAFGSTTDLAADGDGSGEIDSPDYAVWALAYGQVASGVAVATPEPTSVWLACLSLGAGLPLRRPLA